MNGDGMKGIISKAVAKRVAQLEPIVGLELAKAQANYEFRHRVRRARETGEATLKQIGDTVGLSAERVRCIQVRADRENKRGSTPPLQAYIERDTLIGYVKGLTK